jgi:hypothetical protein
MMMLLYMQCQVRCVAEVASAVHLMLACKIAVEQCTMYKQNVVAAAAAAAAAAAGLGCSPG